MTLKEAIERQAIMLRSRDNSGYHQETGALKLGIEAMKRMQAIRADEIVGFDRLLPGETQE